MRKCLEEEPSVSGWERWNDNICWLPPLWQEESEASLRPWRKERVSGAGHVAVDGKSLSHLIATGWGLRLWITIVTTVNIIIRLVQSLQRDFFFLLRSSVGRVTPLSFSHNYSVLRERGRKGWAGRAAGDWGGGSIQWPSWTWAAGSTETWHPAQLVHLPSEGSDGLATPGIQETATHWQLLLVVSSQGWSQSSRNSPRASLVAQWLRICLPTQGTRVRALVWEDPTCRGATRPVSHKCWACASGACAPQQERPRQWEARAPRRRVAPARRN